MVALGLFTIKTFDKLFFLPKEFHIDDLKIKKRKTFLDLLNSFKFLSKTENVYSKTDLFLVLQTNFNKYKNYNFILLSLSFEILKSLNVSKDDPFVDFKNKLKDYPSNIAVLIRQILFSAGFLYKKGNQYVLTSLATLIIVRPQSGEQFIQNLTKFLDNEINNIFIISLKSLKLNPKYAVVSNDFSVSFTTKWIQNVFTKQGQKATFKRIFNEEFRPTEIFFEGDRSTNQKKAFISIFPILQ